MTMTDELCRLLNERGAEYRFNDVTKIFEWHYDGTDGEGFAHATEVDGGINIIACSLTPAQAIAATLGDADLAAENAKLRELVALMYRDMQGVLDMSTDTVWVDDFSTLRDEMDYHMQDMAELGMPPADYERRMRELGAEASE